MFKLNSKQEEYKRKMLWRPRKSYTCKLEWTELRLPPATVFQQVGTFLK